MKLFVICKYCRNKLYINSPAKIRGELPFQFIVHCRQMGCSANGRDAYYTRNEVFAESNVSNAVSGAILLGSLGAVVAGPIGAAVGGLIGIKAGSDTDKQDKEAVERFNNSW